MADLNETHTKEQKKGLPGLKQVLDRKGIKPPALARTLELNQTTVYNWILGRNSCTNGMLDTLATTLDCSTDELLGRTAPEQSGRVAS